MTDLVHGTWPLDGTEGAWDMAARWDGGTWGHARLGRRCMGLAATWTDGRDGPLDRRMGIGTWPL